MKSAMHVLCLVVIAISAQLIIQGCQKTNEPLSKDAADARSAEFRRKPNKPPPPPPPPPPFYFSDCSFPLYAVTLVKGQPANTTITKNYVNSPGGSYAAYTSNTANGITITAPAGTFNVGSGSVTFTVTGTPVTAGLFGMTIKVGNIIPCNINIEVNNPSPDPATCGGDPGSTPGTTGCVTFNYRGQTVTYTTVRARDGKIWLQQNLGSPRVAYAAYDAGSFGHYFQWGRWDDGHQLSNSTAVFGTASLQNPSHIVAGDPRFVKGPNASNKWWGMGGAITDSWSGTMATSTNGKDPCAALGPGWRMPTATDWQTVAMYEDFEGTGAAYQTNLKLTAAGYRLYYDGFTFQNGDNGNYWSSSAGNSNTAKAFSYDDHTYSAGVALTERGQGLNCRCVKD